MAIVQKINKQLTVANEDVDNYLKIGYDLIDENGNIIKNAVDKAINYKAHLAELKAKDDLIEELKEMLAKLELKNNNESEVELLEKSDCKKTKLTAGK